LLAGTGALNMAREFKQRRGSETAHSPVT